MGASTIPGPVRVAVAVDAGIALVFVAGALVGVPEGRSGTVLVSGEAAVWAVVVLGWVFHAFWSRWCATIERLFAIGGGGDRVDARPLSPWPSRRALAVGSTLFAALVAAQASTAGGHAPGVAYRSVVAAYVAAGALGAAFLAVVADVSSLLADTRVDD